MARSDKPLRPGAPSGFSTILGQAFGVPETPTLSQPDVIARVKEELTRRSIEYDCLAISDAPVRRNTLFDLAGRRVAFPEGKLYDRCFVVLIDLEADARWAHRAYWAFIPASGNGPVELRDTHLPEHPKGQVRLYPIP